MAKVSELVESCSTTIKSIISTITIPMAFKLDHNVTQSEAVPYIKSHDP